MKIIQILSVAAIAAAFTVSASAFPYTNPTYTVGPLNAAPPAPSAKGGSIASSASASSTVAGSTVAVYTQGRSIGQQTKAGKARLKSANHQ